jgi:hypothetical protein
MDAVGIDLAERDEMNRIARILFLPVLPALLLFFSLVETTSFAQVPPHQPSQMTLWQARRAMAAALGITGIRFSPDGFEYDAMTYKKVPYTVKIDLATPPALVAKCGSRWCTLKDEAGRDPGRSLPKNSATKSFLYRSWSDPGSGKAAPILCLLCSNAPYTCSADCVNQAQTFVLAFNTLHAFAVDTNAPLRTFTQRAAAWRALATRPPIPDEVRVQRMMAEDAFKANKPDEALRYYEAGVLLYPTWPEGNFNAALIAGDLGYYDAAIEHMQAYLELVPDAADAQAARDKILIWQTKAKEK